MFSLQGYEVTRTQNTATIVTQIISVRDRMFLGMQDFNFAQI